MLQLSRRTGCIENKSECGIEALRFPEPLGLRSCQHKGEEDLRSLRIALKHLPLAANRHLLARELHELGFGVYVQRMDGSSVGGA